MSCSVVAFPVAGMNGWSHIHENKVSARTKEVLADTEMKGNVHGDLFNTPAFRSLFFISDFRAAVLHD